jgi:hypothetical protein
LIRCSPRRANEDRGQTSGRSIDATRLSPRSLQREIEAPGETHGRALGELRGDASTLLAMLGARRLPVDESAGSRIAGNDDATPLPRRATRIVLGLEPRRVTTRPLTMRR